MEQKDFDPLSITKYWKDMKPPNLDQLRRTKTRFDDQYFPANTNTLLSKNSKGDYIDKVEGPKKEEKISGTLLAKLEWKRLSGLGSNWKLFNNDQIQCSDVIQGELGDCYFLGSVAALAQYPYLIAEKFRTKEYNDIGYYEMIFFIDGEWQVIFVDDFTPYNVPCQAVAFASPNKDNIIWPLLLEKAWAKVNGGYTNIVGGDSADALFALSGFPTSKENSSENDPDVIFKTLKNNVGEGTIMTSSVGDNCKEAREYGLVIDHAYSILNVKSKPDEDINLIQLRNPWGKTDWKGAWCNRSTQWTKELKQYFNYKNSNDGIFWMSINDFIYFCDSYNICHLMYGCLIKTYLFKKEKYFNSPIVFNINIQKASDFSISVIFKHWRFNRNLKDTQRPFGLILAKIDPSNQVEKLYMKRTSNEDIHFFKSLTAGHYLIWLFCYYKKVKNDPNFFYALSIKCKIDFKAEFIGFDTDFNLLHKLAIGHYNLNYSNDQEKSDNLYLGYDDKFTESGVFNYMVCNGSNSKWANVTIIPKLKNLILLPPFQNMNTISLSIPPQGKIPLLAMRITNEASSFQIQTSTMMDCKAMKEIPKELTCSRFFNNNFGNNNQFGNSLVCGEYKYVSKEKLSDVPIFKKEEYVPAEIFKRSMMKIQTITKETLIKEYPEEMKRLLTFTELYNANIVQWDKIPSTDGIYIGEVNKITTTLQGRGIYIWSIIGMKYIGYWMNGEMNNYGCIYDKNLNKIFDGEYNNGKKEGFGVLTINKTERIEGKFHNDELNGNGKYIYSNGSQWEGPFEKCLRHGMGVMTYENKDQYNVLYYYDEFIGKYEKNEKNKPKVQKDNEDKIKVINQNEKKNPKIENKKEKEIIQTKEDPKTKNKHEDNNKKKIKQIEKEKDKPKEVIIVNPKKIKQNNDQETSLDLGKNNDFLFDLEDYSKFLKIEEDPYVEIQIKETEEERNQKMIETLKKSDPFMMEQIYLLPPLDDKEMFNKITRNKTIMIGHMVNGKLNGRGGIYDGRYYNIGYFKDDLPNGFFRKFLQDKTITYEGILNNNSLPNWGKLYFSDGSYYIGSISPKWKLNGLGVFYNKNNESWTGNFEESLMQGAGKNIMDNGFLIRDLLYEKGKILSVGNYRFYNTDSNANSLFLITLKTKHEKIYNALMMLKPDRSLIDPIWKQVIFQSEDILIGETDSAGKFNGRGCRLFTTGLIKYYIGYFRDNKFENRGKFYDDKWVLLYDGQISNNTRNGFGKEYLASGKVHIGYFKDNKFEGQGVSILPNGKRFEGIFKKGYRHGKGFEIFNPPITKKPIEYKEGMIVSQEDNIKCSTLAFNQTLVKQFKEINATISEHIKLLESLKKTKDTSVLIKGEKYYVEGYYIGELNNIGFRHGRGIQFDFNKASFYVGYFEYNQKEGSGRYYYEIGNMKYEGQYKNDEPYGKGKYYYISGDTLEGQFNEIGVGKGTYTFKDGSSWAGDFQYHMRNGKGDQYDAEKKLLGEVSYINNQKLN